MPVNERVASLMQLLAECADSESPGAIATVFQTEGEVETSIGTTALLFPDGTIDGESIAPSIFDDLMEVAITNSSTIKRYELSGGSVDVFLQVVQPRVRLVIFGAGCDVLPVVSLAKNLGCHTSVIDTSARVSSIELFSEADVVWLCRPEEIKSVLAQSDDEHLRERLGSIPDWSKEYDVLGSFSFTPGFSPVQQARNDYRETV